MKQLSTVGRTFLVNQVVAEAVLALALAALAEGTWRVVHVPVVRHEEPDEVQLLIGPATQLAVSSSDRPETELDAAGVESLRVLVAATAALARVVVVEAEPVGLDLSFVDFDAYPLPRTTEGGRCTSGEA